VYPFGADAPTVPTPVVYEPPPTRHTGRYLIAAVLALVVLGGIGVAVFALRVGGGHAGERATSGAPALPPPSPASVLAVPASSAPASASPSPSPTDPNLVGQDDFTGPALDTSRWSTYDSTSPNGSTWSSRMVTVVGGELRIAGVGRNPTGAGNASGGLCWCGPDGDRLYGKWQVRARFDAGAGYGPVIGLWPKSGKGDEAAIGFGECLPADRRSMHGYLVGTGTPRFFERTLAGDFTAWHTYTVEWRAKYVKISVDGKLVLNSATQPGVLPPATPMHLYLQQIAGPGDGVGAPDAHTPASVTVHVDWVRVYR
jgi:beta-glucanase (GH16 family)